MAQPGGLAALVGLLGSMGRTVTDPTAREHAERRAGCQASHG